MPARLARFHAFRRRAPGGAASATLRQPQGCCVPGEPTASHAQVYSPFHRTQRLHARHGCAHAQTATTGGYNYILSHPTLTATAASFCVRSHRVGRPAGRSSRGATHRLRPSLRSRRGVCRQQRRKHGAVGQSGPWAVTGAVRGCLRQRGVLCGSRLQPGNRRVLHEQAMQCSGDDQRFARRWGAWRQQLKGE